MDDVSKTTSLTRKNVLNRACFLLVVAVAAVLCFTGLGTRSLWQDESETALLARSVLTEGVPKVVSGSNIVLQDKVGYDKHYRWTFHPWGHIYLAAAGLAIFQNTEFAVRLPFALCGVLTVALLYIFALRHFKSAGLATLAALLLAACPVFVLHARQCRYYGLTMLTFLLVIAVFIELMKRPSWRWSFFWAAALAAQFYADFGTLAVMLPGLMVAVPAMGARKRQLVAVVAGLALALVFVGPGIMLHWSRFTTGPATGERDWLWRLLVHICYVDGWFAPLLLLLPAGGALAWRLVRNRDQTTEQNRIVITCVLVMCSFVVGMIRLVPYLAMRYIMPGMSLAKLLLAVTLVKGHAVLRTRGLRSTPAATILVTITLILMLTNIVSLPVQYLVEFDGFRTPDFCTKSRPFVRADLAGLIYELTHDFVCPNRVAANVADDLAEPGDTVVINYGDMPLMFYRPDLKIRGWWYAAMNHVEFTALKLPESPGPPDIIIKRTFEPVDFDEHLRPLLSRHQYQRLAIDVPAMNWGNIPEPSQHHFATPSERFAFEVYLRADHKDRLSKLPQTFEELEARWYRRR